MHSPLPGSTFASNRNIGGTEIKRLPVIPRMTLREFVDRLYEEHPVERFKNQGDRIIYIIRDPDSNRPLPVEFAF